MPANIGDQTVTILYYMPANSADVNRRHKGIRQVGIYSGGYLSVVDNSHALLSLLVCEVSDSSHQVRIETASAINIAVVVGTPYIVLRWTYTGSTADYMEILAVATPTTNDLVVGKCSFTGGGALQGFDYSERSTPNTQDLFLKVEPTENTELKVRVRAGRIRNGRETIIVPDQVSDLFTLPSSNSRVYLLYVDISDGTIKIDSSGVAASSPVAPDYGTKLVLAEITLSSTDNNITASKIKDVRCFITGGTEFKMVEGSTLFEKGVNWTLVGDTWTDMDLSSIVPTNTQAVILRIWSEGTLVGAWIKFRAKGGEMDQAHINHHVLPVGSNSSFIVPCDENRKIQYYTRTPDDFTSLTCRVVGWFL